MTLTLHDCAEEIRHALGARSGGVDPASVKRLANRAGQYVFSMHAWKFREQRAAHLDFRAPFSVTGATWTEATKTLTKTGGFASYVFLAGDEVEVTSGTGATPGFYHIASRTSDDAIVLETSIGAAADSETDIAGSFVVETIALPPDFLEARSVQARDSVTDFFEWVSPAELQEMRNNEPSSGSLGYYGCITYHTPAAGGVSVPLLSLWPEPGAAQVSALRMLYRSKWADLADDNSKVSLPDWMETLYLQTVRAFAGGYWDEDVMPLEARLALVEQASYTVAAKRQDGSVQPAYGWIRGGAAESVMDGDAGRFWGNFVQAPS